MTQRMDEKSAKIFNRAVVNYAVKLDMDPLVIEKAYEGRAMMLVVREDQKENWEVGAAMGGVFTAAVAGGTLLTIAKEADSYNSDGPMNNIEIGGGIGLIGLLALGACIWKRKKIVNAVKGDIERFSGNPQPLLPKPENPKLI